jgi:hypothetical protein
MSFSITDAEYVPAARFFSNCLCCIRIKKIRGIVERIRLCPGIDQKNQNFLQIINDSPEKR